MITSPAKKPPMIAPTFGRGLCICDGVGVANVDGATGFAEFEMAMLLLELGGEDEWVENVT